MLRVDRQRECTCLDLSWTHELSERSRALVIAATILPYPEDRTTHTRRGPETRGKRGVGIGRKSSRHCVYTHFSIHVLTRTMIRQ